MITMVFLLWSFLITKQISNMKKFNMLKFIKKKGKIIPSNKIIILIIFKIISKIPSKILKTNKSILQMSLKNFTNLLMILTKKNLYIQVFANMKNPDSNAQNLKSKNQKPQKIITEKYLLFLLFIYLIIYLFIFVIT